MRHQPHRLRPLARFFRHSPVQFTDLRLQPVERFQQPLAPLGRVRQQRQLLQLCSPCLRPQLAFFLHPTTQSHGLQLILGARPRLHPSTSSGQALLVTMHQQLPHMPHLQARHPDPRKPILHQQLQQVLRVPSTVRCPTPRATARTTDSGRKPPSPPALPGPPATGKTAPPPPRSAATASLESLLLSCQRSRPVETQDQNHTL